MEKDSSLLLSLIIPVWSDESQFIRGCLTDLDQQTIAGNIEVILVGTGDISQNYTKEDVHNVSVKIVKAQKESLFSHWNAGIKDSHAPFVSVIHPADRYRKDAFEQLVAIFDSFTKVDLVYSDVLLTTQANETYHAHSARNALRFPDYDRQTFLKRGFAEIRPVWRRSLHDTFGFLDKGLIAAADLEFWLRVSEEAGFYRVPEFLALRYDESDAHLNRMGTSDIERRKEFTAVLPYYENNYSWQNGLVSDKITRLNRIERLFNQNKRASGEKSLDEALKEDPDDQELWVSKIRHLMEARELKLAKSVLKEALKRFPDDVRLVNYKAIQLWRDGYKQQARTTLEEIVEDNPLEMEIRQTLSEMYGETGDASKAIEQILFLINQGKDNLSLYVTLITKLLKQNDVIRARYYYHLAVKKYPSGEELQKISHLFSRPKVS